MQEMAEFGMEVTPEERQVLVKYLATYLGPDPPPVPDRKPVSPVAASPLDPAKLYERHCSTCHGLNGKGVPHQTPPLAGNPYLLKDNRYTIAVILYGLQGPITIRDLTYAGVMPGFAHLSDPEISAMGHYILTAWGGTGQTLPKLQLPTPELVRTTRAEVVTADEMARRRRLLQ